MGENKKYIKNQYLSHLLETLRITSFADLILSSLIIGMAFTGFFIVLVLLSVSIAQFFGGVKLLVDYFAHSYDILSKIDSSFGTGNTVSLLLAFIPMAFALAYFILHLLEEYMDTNLGKIQESDLLRRMTLYWIIASVLFVPFVGSFVYSMIDKIFGLQYSNTLLAIALFTIQCMISMLTFSFIYRILSKGFFPWKTAVISGVTAGILFELFKYIFLFLLKKQSDMPFTAFLVVAFILFGVWFFINAIIFTFGVRVGYYYEFRDVFRPENRELLESSDFRATREIALICLMELTKRFYASNDTINKEAIGLDIRQLCTYSLITPIKARAILQHLSNVRLIRILQDGDRESVMLNFSPDKLSLDEFIFKIEEKINLWVAPNLPDYRASNWFWTEYKKTLSSCFKDTSFKDLYDIQNT